MLGEAKQIYLATRKKHDQLFNTYVMRPLAGGVVALLARTSITPNQVTLLNLAVFVVAAALLMFIGELIRGDRLVRVRSTGRPRLPFWRRVQEAA